MHLLITSTRRSTTYALVADYDRAKELARAHVGEKTSDVDGCATKREEWENAHEHTFRAWRRTSWGQAKAEVQVIKEVA